MTVKSFSIPAAAPLEEQRGENYSRLVELMQRLLAQDGCPWDRAQTFQSMRKYVLEEACEVIDAIDEENPQLLKEELGDLALQIAFLGELSRAAHGFGPDDIFAGICEKLVRRHPHVFSDASAKDAEAVAKQWEEIKATEKPRSHRLLDRVPRSMPPLERARQLSERAARVGFDWPDASGSREKVSEELGEVDEAISSGDRSEIESELGDLLFATVNLARHHGVDPNVALAGTCKRFTRRFASVEDQVISQLGDWPRNTEGKPTRGVSLDQLESYWLHAKKEDEL